MIWGLLNITSTWPVKTVTMNDERNHDQRFLLSPPRSLQCLFFLLSPATTPGYQLKYKNNKIHLKIIHILFLRKKSDWGQAMGYFRMQIKKSFRFFDFFVLYRSLLQAEEEIMPKKISALKHWNRKFIWKSSLRRN